MKVKNMLKTTCKTVYAQWYSWYGIGRT